MRHKNLVLSAILIITALFSQGCAQTQCIWIVKSQENAPVQKIAVSLPLVKLLSSTGGDFDVNGVKMSYESLLEAYREGSVKRIKDGEGNGETKIFGGRFDRGMNESSEKHDHLIIESTEGGSEPKVSKIRVKSVEAVAMLLALIGSKDFDNDRIEDALERGGILYIGDEQKDSRLWIYVN